MLKKVKIGLLIAIVLFALWIGLRLQLSNYNVNRRGKIYLTAEIVSNAFEKYAKLHGNRYPKFVSSVELAASLREALRNEAASVNSEGKQYVTEDQLQVFVIQATWNKSLSGAQMILRTDSPRKWLFYIRSESESRFAVSFSDHTLLEVGKDELQELKGDKE